jgi:hypothetical protein
LMRTGHLKEPIARSQVSSQRPLDEGTTRPAQHLL